MKTTRNRNWVRWTLIAVLLLFGGITLFLSASVLFDLFGMRVLAMIVVGGCRCGSIGLHILFVLLIAPEGEECECYGDKCEFVVHGRSVVVLVR